MAQNVTINGVDYPAVPGINIPLTAGSGNALYLDAADYRTAAAQDVIDAEKIEATDSTLSSALPIDADTLGGHSPSYFQTALGGTVETWTFTLEDETTVTKKVLVLP